MTTLTKDDVLNCAKACFARSIKTAQELAGLPSKPNRAATLEPGFVAEMIANESTRAGAVHDALYALCPELEPELRKMHAATAATLRDLRWAAIESIGRVD